MDAIFGNLRNTVIAGFVLAGLVFLLYLKITGYDGGTFWLFFLRWLHVICGVMWIGLLWYFNFVATPTTPKIPEELRRRSASTSRRRRCSGSAGPRWARSCSASSWPR